MSISSPIQPPGVPPSSGPPQPAPPGTAAKAILKHAEEAMRENIQRGNPDARQIIRGEVTKFERDGTAHIQTDKGRVEVQMPADGPHRILRPGDKVEIDIPPRSQGRPSHEVDIRVTERAPPARTQDAAASQNAPRTSETPVEVRLEPPPPPLPEDLEALPPARLPPLEPGQPVRLQPLPPELLTQITLPQPDTYAAARLEALRALIMQALPNTMEALEDIPLRPVLSTQTEINIQFPPAVLPETPALQALAPPLVTGAASDPAPGSATPVIAPSPPPAAPGKIEILPGSFPPAAMIPPFLTQPLTQADAPAAPATTAFPFSPQIPAGTPSIVASTLESISVPPGMPPVLAQTGPDGNAIPAPAAPLLVTQATLASVIPPDTGAVPQPAAGAAPELSLQVGTLMPPGVTLTDPAAAEPRLQAENSLILKEGAKPDILIATVSGIVKGSVPVVSVAAPSAGGLTGEAQPPLLYLLHTPGPMAVMMPGTELALEMPARPITTSLSASAAQSTSTFMPLPYPVPFLSPEIWPALDQIYQSLAAAAPQTASSLMNASPNPRNPAQMMPAALFFIAAIRAGDLQGWLGDRAVESLKSGGKAGLLSRLLQEGGALSRLASEPLSGDWRGMAFPLAWQNEIHKIALYYKREDREDSDNEAGGKGTRFIMDLSLSQIGRVQLDGYMRGKSFDLILRTDQAFSGAARVSMQTLYQDALEFEGLSGDLGFQNKPEQWVKITGSGRETFLTNA